MNKINNKLINFGLIIIAIFTFNVVILPEIVQANDDTFFPVQPYTPPVTVTTTPSINNPVPSITSINPNSINLGENIKPITIIGSNFIPNSVARWNGSNKQTTFIDYSHLLIYLNANDMTGSSGSYITVFNPAPNGGYSNAIFFTINGYVAPNTSTTNTTTNVNNIPNTSETTNTNVNPNDTNTNGTSNLAAAAIFGSGQGFLPTGLIAWLFIIIFILLVVMLVRKIYLTNHKDNTPLKHA